jgi:hypothetical protein
MDQHTIEMNRRASTSQTQDSFIYRYRKVLFWILLIVLMFVTWYFSQSIETRGTDSASIFLSGSSRLEIVELYVEHAVPATVSVRAGDSVEFVVKDGGRHYISERRSSTRHGDARISSGEFGPGESYSIQFNTVGTFSFYDRMNQDISIDIEVR